MEDKEWLASLKIGDKVAIERYSYGTTSFSIKEVSRIMKTRIIAGDIIFNAETGKQIRGKDAHWNSTSMQLMQITDTIKNEILRQRAISECKSIVNGLNPKEFNDLTLEESRYVLDSLKKVAEVVTTRHMTPKIIGE